MATQEERLKTVEQKVETLQQKTAKAIQEIEENTTIMLGVMRSQGRDIRYIFERLETLNTIEQRLDRLEQRFDQQDQRLDRLEQRFDRLETKFDQHTTLLTQILARLPNNP